MKLMYLVSVPAPTGTRVQARIPASDGAMVRWHRGQVSGEELA